ncbi:MAG TPA: penicillin-insensitive murein endopeptidase [Thermohalobaculum sp.]|nr:penicillin-insensitive murein endopeptidase [Thermohalobaculum sp.]
MRLLMLALALALAAPATAADARPAKELFGARSTPSALPPAPHGSYARGCLAGAVEVPETAMSWQAMRLSRNRNWAHPAMLDFLGRLGAKAQAIGWPRIYVGDISQPRGGPMLTGHSSHQIGLDADIWLKKPVPQLLNEGERERISSTVVVRPDERGVNEHWTAEHQAVIRAAAEDPALSRIFVNAAIKKAMCEATPAGDRAWLGKVRPWWKHDSHFHVRLGCPAGAEGCVDQAPPPAGDGCGEELAWWFSDERFNPPPSAVQPPKPPLDLADLPPACAAVLER